MRKVLLICLLGCACTEQVQLIPPPEAVGLAPVRPYPQSDSPCYVIGESEASVPFLDDSSLLIGCPRAFTQHIAQRTEEGARVVAYIERWALLSQPLR